MATTISGTSGVTTPAIVDTGPLSVGPQGITFADSTVQTSAYGATIPTYNVYSSPGTWTKPALVKWIKVTVVGGGGGSGGINGGAGGGGGGGGGSAQLKTPAEDLSATLRKTMEAHKKLNYERAAAQVRTGT